MAQIATTFQTRTDVTIEQKESDRDRLIQESAAVTSGLSRSYATPLQV